MKTGGFLKSGRKFRVIPLIAKRKGTNLLFSRGTNDFGPDIWPKKIKQTSSFLGKSGLFLFPSTP
jgi:hypothetical protein